jgi:hypothetical protein
LLLNQRLGGLRPKLGLLKVTHKSPDLKIYNYEPGSRVPPRSSFSMYPIFGGLQDAHILMFTGNCVVVTKHKTKAQPSISSCHVFFNLDKLNQVDKLVSSNYLPIN